MSNVKLDIKKSLIEDVEMKSFLSNIENRTYIKSSSVGVDSITANLPIVEFVVSAVLFPIVFKLVRKKKIIVKFKGVKFENNPETIIKVLSVDKKLRERCITAYKNSSMELNGDIRNIAKFTEQLDELLSLSQLKNE